MSIRLLISDVDGTLVRHDKSLSDANVAAIRRLQDAGVGVTLISARPPSGILPLAAKLGIRLPLGAYNGGTLIRPDGEIVEAHRLDRDVAESLLRLTDEAGADPWVFADGRWHCRTLDNPHVPRERLSAGQEPVLVESFDSLLTRVDKLVSVSDDHALLRGVQERGRAAAGERANVVFSQVYFLDTTAPAANKGDGVAALAQAAGVSLDEVAVFGDMPNDIPMFRRAGLSVAMGQASDEVKAAATQAVGASNEDDGVAQAIETVLLPRLRSGQA